MPANKRLFRITDCFRHRNITGVTASRDGRTVAFAVDGTGLKANEHVSHVWSWREGRGARQVTFAGRASQPRFSPGGGRLAFVSTRDGGRPQIFVMDRALSEGRPVTSFEHGVVKFEWSPNGRRLAVVAPADRTDHEKKSADEKRDWRTVDADERRRALWTVSASGAGKPRRLSAAGEHVSTAAWLPDGRHLV